LNKIEDLLARGISEETIAECIERDAYSLDKLASNHARPKSSKNLIQPNQFYYHPALQVAPPPPVIKINDDGTFTESYSEEEFFLKIKECFTLQDAIEYLYSKSIISSIDKKEAPMKYVYENKIMPVANQWASAGLNALDLLLFTIDAAHNILAQDTSLQMKLENGIFGLIDYIDHGLEIYKEKVNYCKLSDLTHVY
jgi:hypothetical protein